MRDIEEDIKIIQSLDTTEDEELAQAIEHLINDYKRQKQINEEHQKENRRIKRKSKKIRERKRWIIKRFI